MISEITSGWERLLEDPQPNMKTLIYPDSQHDLYLVLRSVSPQVRVFYITVESDTTNELPELPQANGFEVSILPDESDGYSKVEIALYDMEFEKHFDILIEDICKDIETRNTDRETIFSFLDAIIKWQQFVEKRKLDILSEEKRRGLVGELICLKDLIIPQSGAPAAIESWTGPLRDSQAVRDFEYEGIGVEVKTTTSRRPQRFSVSNERQLDDSQISAVIVFHISMDVKLTTGESLYGLVTHIREIMPDITSKVLLEKRLHDYGYSDEYEELYDRWKYSIREQTIYKVSETFPRIIEPDIPTGVSNVRYDVSIEQCLEHKIETSDLFNLFKGDTNE